MPSLGFGQLPTYFIFFFPSSCLQRAQRAHASSGDQTDGLTDWPVISIRKVAGRGGWGADLPLGRRCLELPVCCSRGLMGC